LFFFGDRTGQFGIELGRQQVQTQPQHDQAPSLTTRRSQSAGFVAVTRINPSFPLAHFP